jgi:phage-related protein
VKYHINQYGSKGRRAEAVDLARTLEDRLYGVSADRAARDGYALFLAQMGERHSTMAKTLGGFGGATVIEVRESHDGNAYRAVYTVRFADAVYVLHAFQKKSKKGIATPKAEIDLIQKRLKDLIEEKEERQ